MGETQETEITLGTGKLLGIFFGLVIICAAFFTMGYMLGRGSAPAAASTTVVSTVPTSGGNPANKPSANGGKATDAQACPAGSTNCTPAGSGPDASFYNSVTSSTPNTSGPTANQASANPAPPDSGNGKPPDSTTTTPAPELKSSAASYTVQVAAVTRQEDADILVNALRKKQYPVFVVANLPGDSLYHIQVGPFSDQKEAEAMRSRLAGDGYNAIVKK
jgi:cell division septation protein DedD